MNNSSNKFNLTLKFIITISMSVISLSSWSTPTLETLLEEQRPLQLSESNWQGLKQAIQEQKILAADFDNIAFSISLDPVNNQAVLGATTTLNYGANSGSAYVFTENNGNWDLTTKLLANDGFAGQRFGYSVAIDGQWIAVGAPGLNGSILGHTYLFKYNGQQWFQFDKLASGENNPSNLFGISVKMANNTLFVGDPHSVDINNVWTGAVFAFEYDPNSDQWLSPDKLSASDVGSGFQFGLYLDISSDAQRVVVSASRDNTIGTNGGAVHVFDWNGITWIETVKLIGSNVTANSYFGTQVAISDSGKTIATKSTNTNNQYEVYVFEEDTSWQETAIISDNNNEGSFFAHTLDVSDHVIAIGRFSPRNINIYQKINGNWSLDQEIIGVSNVGLYDFDIQGDRMLAANINIGASYFENLAVGALKTRGSDCLVLDCEWSEQGTMVSTSSTVDDNFGVAIDVSGDNAIIGAFHDDENGSNAGAAYIFSMNNGIWNQKAKLIALDGDAGDLFGRAVAIDGNRAVVGALSDDHFDSDVSINIPDAGSVYVFERQDGNLHFTWIQTDKITADEGLLAAGDLFGSAVDVKGDRIVVGARYDDENGTDAGAAYVYDYNEQQWNQSQKIMPLDSNPEDAFGYSVSLDSNRILVGAYLNDEVAIDTGAAYVYQYIPLLFTWQLQDKLTPVLLGTAGDYFGTQVELQGDQALISALLDDSPNTNDNSGSVYYFKKDDLSGNWLQHQVITASDREADDQFGYSMFVDGDQVLIGSWLDDDNGMNSGAAYLFKYNPDSDLWSEHKKIIAEDGESEDYFGVATALSGDYILIGAHQEDSNGSTNSGAIYVFKDDVIFKNEFE